MTVLGAGSYASRHRADHRSAAGLLERAAAVSMAREVVAMISPGFAITLMAPESTASRLALILHSGQGRR
jgi:hypothetical protein